MPITNRILEQIKNPCLKEILEATLYVNSQPDGEVYTTRSQPLSSNPAARANQSVADCLISQNLPEAVRLALESFSQCEA